MLMHVVFLSLLCDVACGGQIGVIGPRSGSGRILRCASAGHTFSLHKGARILVQLAPFEHLTDIAVTVRSKLGPVSIFCKTADQTNFD